MDHNTQDLYAWIHDDITWCANECSNTACRRNLANKLSKKGLFSMAELKNTDLCPLKKEITNKLNVKHNI